MKQYDFQEQKGVGDTGERILDAFFMSLGYEVEEVNMAEQRKGIDRIIVTPDGKELKIEYKTDALTASTGNVFIETISSTKSGALGWALKTQANFVVYYVPDWSKALIIDPKILREMIPIWIFQYHQKPVKNAGYFSFGIPVPWNVMKQFCKEIEIKVEGVLDEENQD